MTLVSTPNDLIDWLLVGDVAIQHQVRRDLLDEERSDLGALRVLKPLGNSTGPDEC